jgi:uncharacterized protein (DUF1697 family)
MSVQVALLRAVNVGGTGKVSMAELRDAAQTAGLKNVRSLLQSGNLLFDAGPKTPAAVEKALEAVCAKTFGIETSIYVRTAAEIAATVARNPFAKEAKDDPARLHVLFMREAPDKASFVALQAAIKGRELVLGDGRHAYIVYPDGAGNSKLTSAVIMRHLGTPGTARNWNTVSKLAALAAE